MRSSFFGNLDQGRLPGHFTLQNAKMLRVQLNGEVLARQGSMVAFQGQMEFDYQGAGGVGRFLKKMVTGEGAPLMRVRGQGMLFLADNADDVHLFYLEDEAITVNGTNLLAFDPQLTWDIQRVQGAGIATGGLFNTTVRGTGWVAVTAHGAPVLLDTSRMPTFADSQSAVCWSAGLQVGVNRTFKAGALIGRGSGEAAQLAFQGQGFVLVQASEGPIVPQSNADRLRRRRRAGAQAVRSRSEGVRTCGEGLKRDRAFCSAPLCWMVLYVVSTGVTTGVRREDVAECKGATPLRACRAPES